MKSFNEWLSEAYPNYSYKDFDSEPEYWAWYWGLSAAYLAGWKACQDMWGGYDYVDTVEMELLYDKTLAGKEN